MRNLKEVSYEEALTMAKKGKFVQRECMLPDTVVISYKNRLMQMSQATGVRYPYVPTNADIHAIDWRQVKLTKITE